jgi:hypothetical protein
MLRFVRTAVAITILSAVGLMTYGLGLYRQQTHEQSLWVNIEFNRLISAALAKLLEDVPHASVARVALIHATEPTVAGAQRLAIDHANTMVPPGRTVPEYQRNIPLSQWNEDMEAYAARRCVVHQTRQLANAEFRERLLPLQVVYYIACPLVGANGIVYGAVFLTWDDLANIPQPADLDAVVKQVRSVTVMIGRYYRRMA